MRSNVLLSLTLVIWFTFGSLSAPVLQTAKDDYLKKRSDLIAEEQAMRIGGQMVLTPKEKVVNDLLMKEKRRVIDESRENGTQFLSSASFYLSRDYIDNSVIYKIIQRMPKGAALHLHDLALVPVDWVVKNATYRKFAKMCTPPDGYIRLAFFDKNPPKDQPTCTTWTTVESARQASGDANAFDKMLISNISLLASDPLVKFPTITEVWNRFNIYFLQMKNVIYYEPVTRDYFRQGLQNFHDDGVQYFEMRFLPNTIFQLDKEPENIEATINVYKDVVTQFVKDNPDFTGAKLIYSNIRIFPVSVLLEDVKQAMAMRVKYPDFVLGYDLVGQEDINHSLEFYLDALLYPSQQDPPVDLPFFFHAAETNWQETAVDYNLVDALLLNTSRIGHGFGLVKHPKLAKLIKEKGIAVEVNPISNQLLGLVKDLRNHAMVPLIADDFPIVISSDDPGTWDAAPLSHDFYVAFMTMSGRETDLTLLKQLALNSLKYSKMSDTEKNTAMSMWQSSWDRFINDLSDAITKCQGANLPSSVIG